MTDPILAKPGHCAEAAMGISIYLPCNKPAVSLVGWKGRSDAPIPMCQGCADHNVRNRGGEIISPIIGPASLAAFLNRLKIMKSIDRHELVEAYVIAKGNPTAWEAFRTDPFEWLIRADAETAVKVWAILKRRATL